MFSSHPLSFDNTQREIAISPNGTPANAFEQYPYGAAGYILKKSSLAEIEAEGWDISEVLEEGKLEDCLYLFAFRDGRPNEYIWRENLYPVPVEES